MNLSDYLLSGIAVSAALWLIYRAVLSDWTDYRSSRRYLLIAVLAAALLPCFRQLAPVRSSGLQVSLRLPEISAGPDTAAAHAFPWTEALVAGYVFVILSLITAQLISALRTMRRVRRGTAQSRGAYRLVRNTGIGPGTIGRTVFFPDAAADAAVLSHELGHIRAGHRFDLLLVNLACCVFWINPAIWLLRRELRLVHEFEADQYAVGSALDAESYARLLVRHVMGVSTPAYTHAFFHHPVKQRITMLFASKPSRAARLRRTLTLSLATSLIGVGVLFIQCKAEPSPEPLSVTFEQPEENETESGVQTYAQTMPEFKGDLPAYLAKEIRYPETARKAGAQGRAVMQFVVTDAGKVKDVKVVKSSGSTDLDNEALRVVRAMPDWQPGQDAGKAVSVLFTLPVSFKLS